METDPEVVDVLPRDAIRSVDDPDFGPAYFGEDDDRMVVLAADPPRAYPVRVLAHHEVVNDRVTLDGAERAVAVTWCPICGSGVVYDRTVRDGTPTFGVSGKLADDGLVVYDRATDTEWHQPTGRALSGPRASERLTALPAATTTWGRFRAAHPEGVVLQPPDPGDPRAVYDASAYEAYAAGEEFGLYGMRGTGEPRAWDREDLAPKAVVLGVERNGAAVGYPRERVRAAGGVVRDTVGGEGVVVVDAAGLHAFADPGFELRVGGAGGTDGTLVGDGTTWDPVSGASGDGRELARLPAVRLYAFAWQDAHGPGAFWDGA